MEISSFDNTAIVENFIQEIAVLNVLQTLLKTLSDAIQDADDILPGSLIDSAVKPISMTIERIIETITRLEGAIDSPDLPPIPQIAATLNLREFVSPVTSAAQVVADVSRELGESGSAANNAINDAIEAINEAAREHVTVSENAPSATDDETEGFEEGFFWYENNATNKKLYINESPTTDNAEWKELLDNKFKDGNTPVKLVQTATDYTIGNLEKNSIIVLEVTQNSLITVNLPDPAAYENGNTIKIILDKDGNFDRRGFTVDSTYLYKFPNTINTFTSAEPRQAINAVNVIAEREYVELVSDGASFWHVSERGAPKNNKSVTINIPQDFATLENAYNYANAVFDSGTTLTFRLAAGTHTLNSRLIFRDGYFPLVQIIGDGRSTTTINYSNSGDSYAIQGLYHQSMLIQGVRINNGGLYFESNCLLRSGSGENSITINNAPTTSLLCFRSSTGFIPDLIVTGGGSIGVWANYNSTIDVRDCSVTCLGDGIRAELSSSMFARNASVASNSEAVHALSNSIVWFQNSTVVGGTIGIRAIYGSYVYSVGATVTANTQYNPPYRTIPTSGSAAGSYIY